MVTSKDQDGRPKLVINKTMSKYIRISFIVIQKQTHRKNVHAPHIGYYPKSI